MHEIVTLQFGEQANYVGSHFWNIQESYFTYSSDEESPVNHDINFRPGVGADGSDTYMPRCLIYDLKSNFGSLRQISALYEPTSQGNDPLNWNASPAIHRQQPISPHPYQQALDQGATPPRLESSTVRYWSDYSHVFYHPRSLVPLSTYDIPTSSQLQSFADWTTGVELFENLDRAQDIFDRDVRYFAEECDQMQGFQVFTGVGDAWGGWTSSALQRLRDDFGKIEVWVWALESPFANTREAQRKQTLNSSRSIAGIAPESSLYVPLGSRIFQPPPYLHLQESSWQTSALQAATIETSTLPSRLRPLDGRSVTLADMTMSINRDGLRKVTVAESDVANPDELSQSTTDGVQTDKRMANGLDHDEPTAEDVERFKINASSLSALTEHQSQMIASRDQVFGRAETLRGTWEDESAIEERNIASRDRFASGGGMTIIKQQDNMLFPILTSFPHIFNVPATSSGSVAMRTALSTTSGVAKQLKALADSSRRYHGISIDDRHTMHDALVSMSEEYVEGFEDDIMSEDDDI